MSEIAINPGELAAVPRSKRIQRRLGSFLTVSILLIVSGIVASFSTTVFLRIAQGLPAYSLFFRHLLHIGIGLLIAALIFLVFHYSRSAKSWLRFVIPISFYISLLLVILVKLSGFGIQVNGATRMLNLGFIAFQPSELLKITLVLYLAQLLCWWRLQPLQRIPACERADHRPRTWPVRVRERLLSRPKAGTLPVRCMVIMFAAFGFTIIQPDLGSACIILGAGLMTVTIAGVKLRDLLMFILALVLLAGLALAVFPGKYDYARQRIVTWMNPLENSDGAAYQITQARGAIAGGGVWGRGYLKSDQKMNRLPLSTNDFVFPILVEELGFTGGIAIISMFMLLGLFAIRLSDELEDPFGATVSAALGLTICLQALINIGTTIGTLPLSGMTLPFFSQGGTSLIVSIMMLGVIFALGFTGLKQAREEESRAV